MVLGFFNLTGYGIKKTACSEANYGKIKHLREIDPLGHYIPAIIGHHIILCRNMSDSIPIAVFTSPLVLLMGECHRISLLN